MVTSLKRARDSDNSSYLSPTYSTNKNDLLSFASSIPIAAVEPCANASKRVKVAPPTKITKANSKATNKRPKPLLSSYKQALDLVDKEYKRLEKGYKPNGHGVNTDHVAEAMAKLLPKIDELLPLDLEEAAKYKFIVLMHLAEHSHADLDFAVKMCGYGDSDEYFQSIDGSILEVIEKRIAGKDSSALAQASTTQADASTGTAAFESEEEPESNYSFQKLLGKWPNKQERNQVARNRRNGIQMRAMKRRERRENEADTKWIVNALEDIKAKRKYLEGYGLEEFWLTESSQKLETLCAEPKA